MEKTLQTTARNIIPFSPGQDNQKYLINWLELYFEMGDTTAESSRKVKRRDLNQFFEFMGVMFQLEKEQIEVKHWTPRITRL